MATDLTVYVSHKLTGRLAKDCRAEAAHCIEVATKYGVELLDPVIEEGISAEHVIVLNPMKQLQKFWARDKQLLRQAHVLIDYYGPYKSEGVSHEIGYMRYLLWKPVVRVYPNLGPSVARIDNDYIVNNLDEAFKIAVEKWGTYKKRFLWRLSVVPKGIIKHLWHQMVFAFQ